MMKIGIIGLGYVGMLHMSNCLHIDDVKVIGVALARESTEQQNL